MGLPGDTPDRFRRTLDYALSLPTSVRAYHCLVMPDAVMTRGLRVFDMAYDPRTMAMISCLGWSGDDAGLNLNNGAFKNLRAAADATGFLARRGLIYEVYPATL